MRRWLAITAVCAAILVAPLWAQMHGGSSRGSAPAGHATFSSGSSGHAAFGARSGPAFSSPGFSSRGFSGPAFGTAPRVGVRVGSGFHQSFGTRPTFGGGRGPFFGPRRFRGPVFFSSFSPFFFGYSGYPLYYSDYSYSMVDSYQAYDYYASASNQNSAYLVQQQQDIDRLEDEVARLREERESQETAPAQPPTESESQPSTPTCWCSATSTRRKCRITRWLAERSGFSASSEPPNCRCPGSISTPPSKPTTSAA